MKWRRSVVRASRAKRRWPGRVLSVRYEALLTRTDEEIRTIVKALRLEAPTEKIEIGEYDGFAGQNSSFEDVAGYELSTAPIGRHKGVLGRVAEKTFFLVAGSYMRDKGYAETAGPVAPVQTALAALRVAVEAPLWSIYDVSFAAITRMGLQYQANDVKRHALAGLGRIKAGLRGA